MSDQTLATRKLVLKMSISLDGFAAGPNGDNSWIFRTSTEDSRAWVLDTLNEAGVHVMVAGTYRGMAAYWPYSNVPMAAPMNNTPKAVFARRGIDDFVSPEASAQAVVPSAEVLQSWVNPTVARGDLAGEVARLKAQPGKLILVHGGVRLARSLIAAGLVDEYRLAIHPVLLGRGEALFVEPHESRDLRLVNSITFKAGVIGVVYRPA